VFTYGWIVQCSVHPETKPCPPIPSRLFPVPPGRVVGTDVQTRHERLKMQVKLLLSANRNSYMPRQLAQQRMTLSGRFTHPRYLCGS